MATESIDRIKPAAASSLAVRRFGTQLRITIDRVEKHNALSRETLSSLAATVSAAAADEAVSYIVVRGDGSRYFAAGGDLVDLATIRSEKDTADFAQSSREALDAIRNCPLPVIAFLNGDALGGGAELAMACDLRMIAATARIGYVQAKLAISSAWGGAPDLCAAVGSARALRMMMRAEMIGAAEAVSVGLCDAIVETDLDGNDAQQFLAPIESTPRHVLCALKANVVACRSTSTYQAAREAEHRNLVATWTHPAHWAAVDRILARPRTSQR